MGSRRKRRKGLETEISDDSLVRRPRKTKRRLIVLMLLMAGTVAAMPTIVANTPLRNLLSSTLPVAGWRIESEQVSLSWTGQQTLRGVSLVDLEGKPLLAVETLTLERSLLALATNQNDLGKLTLVRPIVSIVTRAEGSNLEDFLAAWDSGSTTKEQQAASSTNAKPNITVEIIEGVVHGFDEPTKRQWLLDQAALVVELGSQTTGGFALNGNMNLSSGPQGSAGRIKVQFQQIAENQNQLDLLAENLPLTPLEPLLSRLLPGSRLAGTASSTAQVRWTQTSQGEFLVQTSGRLEVSQLDATANALMGDRLQCQKILLPWEVSLEGEVVTIGQLSVDADWAQLALNGSATLDELAAFSLANLPKREANFTGSVKLDQLAAMLPHTLQLREGVQIDSGKLEFSAASQPNDTGTTWIATAKIQNVVGTDGQRTIRWEQPIEADIEAVSAAQGSQIKQFSLNSPFVETDFQTSANEVTGNFQLDLKKFSQEMGQFVDLKSWQFRGTCEGELSLARQPDNQFEASAIVYFTELAVTNENRQIWVEPKLQVDLHSTGLANAFTPQRLATATLKLVGPRDTFDLELLEPVDLNVAEKNWQLQLQGNGPLASWAGRLRPWIESVPEQLEGEAQLKAKVQIAAQAVHVIESEGNVTGLRVRDGAMAIDEPQVQFSGDCRWDATSSSLNSRELQLVSSSLAFRSRNLSVVGLSGEKSSASVPTATGDVAFRANLERLALAYGLVGQPESTWPRGMMAGTLKMSSNAERLQADFSATAEQLQIVRTSAAGETSPGRPDIVWAEPRLESTGKVIYTIATDQLQLQDLQLTGQTIRLAGKATLDKLSTEQLLQAGGNLEYKEEALDQLLASYLGPEVRLQGDRQVRFHVSGKLADSEISGEPTHWSRRWNISTDVGWSTATLYGLPLSSGQLQATLRDGQLQFVPLDIGVGQGRLTASPQVIFDPNPQQLFLPKGPLVSNVQISPQVSETMLKYVAPIVAGATRAEGNFSVTLHETRVPLEDPKAARVLGRLDVHQMRVAPGPMVAELIVLLEQIDRLTKGKQFFQTASAPSGNNSLTISNRQIDFQVSEGRVYHRNLEFEIDGVPVRSHGSVGFDQTLVLEIEIPIQDKWIERQSALQSLAGQTIKIPIRGTFAKPQLDQRAIAELSSQMLQGVATDVIGGEINRALDKLFKSR